MGIFELYLIFQAGTIVQVFTAIAVFSGLFCVFILLSYGDLGFSTKQSIKIVVPIFCFSLIVSVFLPDTETLIMMYSIDEVMRSSQDSEEMQKLPENVVKYMNSYLEEHISDNKE